MNFCVFTVIDLLYFFLPCYCSERLYNDSAQKLKTTKNGYLFKNNKDFRSIPWTSCMLLYWQKPICFCNMGILAADKWFIFHEPNLVWTCVSKWPKYWQLTWSKIRYTYLLQFNALRKDLLFLTKKCCLFDNF